MKQLNKGGRYPIYDAAQTDAYLVGKPVPALPGGEHPDDLLDADEAAPIVGVEPDTVSQYGYSGILTGARMDGRVYRWPRKVLQARRDQPDQRHRQKGARSRQPSPLRDTARPAEVSAWLTSAAEGARGPVTTAEIREHFEVTERTAQRILARAREHIAQ
ncbi:hypothetical protein [Streptomyces sp. NEAU-174]|uniref:hypothetical protein n=1 Tax=Streptomyces sp. NEAU-174 TaxID=3458254 RepID=UPI0040441AD4